MLFGTKYKACFNICACVCVYVFVGLYVCVWVHYDGYTHLSSQSQSVYIFVLFRKNINL